MQWVDASRQLIITHAIAHSLLSCGGMGERMGRQKERKRQVGKQSQAFKREINYIQIAGPS